MASDLLQTLIDRASVPTLLIEIPSGIIAAANISARQLLDLSTIPEAEASLFDRPEFLPGSPLRSQLTGDEATIEFTAGTLSLGTETAPGAVVQIELQRLEHHNKPYALASCRPLAPQGKGQQGQEDDIFRCVFDHCPTPLVFATPDGENIRINKAFSELSGHTPEEVIGRSALDLSLWHHPEERAQARALLEEFGRIDRFEATLRKKTGDTMTCLLSTQLFETQGAQRIISAVTDITSLKKTQQALQASEALFRDFFLTNPVATIITSPSGTIHMVNPAFTNAAGYSAKEVVGRTAQEMQFWRNPEDRERMVAAIREQGYIDNLEANFFGKGGRPMTCLVSSRAVVYEDQLQILSIVHDLTEQKKAEVALKKLDQAKSDFISTATHELRTPLIAVIGYAELLEATILQERVTKEHQSYATIIRSNAEILNRLIDDLIDIDRIQYGRPLGIKRVETRIGEIIGLAIQSVSIRHTTDQIVLNHINPLPETMSIDGGRIIQVIQNLLDNARKYSPEDTRIEVTTLTTDNGVTIAVKDQGIGMTAEQVAQVFTKFYRAAPQNARAGGLGLGLSIVKQIVEDHGGEVTVESTPGEGTTVSFTLPR